MPALINIVRQVTVFSRRRAALKGTTIWRHLSKTPGIATSWTRGRVTTYPSRFKHQPLTFFHTSQDADIETREQYVMPFDKFKEAVEKDEINVIDVRRRDEVHHGRVPAKRYVNVPVQELGEALCQLSDDEFEEKYGVEKPSKDSSDIVFHCLAGVRSSMAVRLAHQAGYTKARHLPGGWEEWCAKGDP